MEGDHREIPGASTRNKFQNIAAKSYPPGYRFVPTDHELIIHLLNKIENRPLIEEIKDVDLYKDDPKTLTETYPELGEKEWYFFTPRNRKYPNGSRPDRTAGGGYWKATGADKNVYSEGKSVGVKKTLVFYEGKHQNSVKTNWIMHEFRVGQSSRGKRHANDMKLDDWVLCRIYEKASRLKGNQKEDVGVDYPIGENSPSQVEDNDHDNIAIASASVVHNNGDFLAEFDPNHDDVANASAPVLDNTFNLADYFDPNHANVVANLSTNISPPEVVNNNGNHADQFVANSIGNLPPEESLEALINDFGSCPPSLVDVLRTPPPVFTNGHLPTVSNHSRIDPQVQLQQNLQQSSSFQQEAWGVENHWPSSQEGVFQEDFWSMEENQVDFRSMENQGIQQSVLNHGTFQQVPTFYGPSSNSYLGSFDHSLGGGGLANTSDDNQLMPRKRRC